MRTLALALLATISVAAQAAPVQICEAQWTDAARDNRVVPVRIRMPSGSARVPLVLFSHGLGGSLDSGTDWADAWAQAGIAVITMQHAGSDRAVLKGGELMQAMRPKQLLARTQDVGFVLDEVGRRQREGVCDLTRIDAARIGMSGHSFGAITTEFVAGEKPSIAGAPRLSDPRIKAAIAFSPSPPREGDAAAAFAPIRMPFLSITGTEDKVPITPWVTPEDRKTPYAAMPAGGKYLLVLAGANHMAFNGQDTMRDGMKPDPHVKAVTIAATTAFWRASLMGDAKAQAWLSAGDGLKAQLASGDSFASK